MHFAFFQFDVLGHSFCPLYIKYILMLSKPTILLMVLLLLLLPVLFVLQQNDENDEAKLLDN